MRYGILLWRGEEYTVTDHNLSAAESEQKVAEYRDDNLPAYSFHYRAAHESDDADTCAKCGRRVDTLLRLSRLRTGKQWGRVSAMLASTGEK